MHNLRWRLILALICLIIGREVSASIGDRLPEFKECLEICHDVNCNDDPTPISLNHRLLLWTCPSECDYVCQHIVTDSRVARLRSQFSPVYQYHGKWPFYRFLGMQEPFSVLFSFMNWLAHSWGLSQIRANISPSYTLRPWYITFGYFGLTSWVASMVFHTRDFSGTEKADYFAAGASVLYGLYFAPIRIFRLDGPTGSSSTKASIVRVWTVICLAAYIGHVSFLSFWRWDYTYNMAANIVVGVIQNILWSTFAWRRYSKSGRLWQAWPGMIVAWVVFAMSLEVLDFVPWNLMIDAHSLWHLGTVIPTIWWYRFLIKDAQEDTLDVKHKALE